jgi:hypothetical protein
MYNLFYDVSVLESLSSDKVGLEAIAIRSRIADFFSHLHRKFLVNLKHAFKDFAHSQIQQYNSKYERSIASFLKDPLLDYRETIVPIPKAMVMSYPETLRALETLLTHVKSDTLLSDLTQFKDIDTSDKVSRIRIDTYSKSDFERDKQTIGKLYGKYGLTHHLASEVLKTPSDVVETNRSLIGITSKYYREIIDLNGLMSDIEKNYQIDTLDPSDKDRLVSLLMTMAYRLSIFATIMDHIQDMENNFVLSMDILRKHSLRNP